MVQQELWRSLELWFPGAPPLTRAETLEWEGETRGHGRRVRYRIRATAVLNAYLREELGWPGIGQAFCIEREEVQEKAGEQKVSAHYGITALSFQEAPPGGCWCFYAVHGVYFPVGQVCHSWCSSSCSCFHRDATGGAPALVKIRSITW